MSRIRLKLLLFDAAGTLIEPAEPVERVYERHFRRRGWEVDAADIRAGFRGTFGGMADPAFLEGVDGDLAEREWWREVVARTAVSAGIDPEAAGFSECFEGLFEHYAGGSAWSVFPEVPGVLRKYRAAGVRMAVVSNFDRRLHRVLEETGLAGFFDAILTSADVSARKPSPVLLRKAMEKFSATPAETMLTGDSLTADGGAAAAAGVGCFILDRPHTTLADFANWLGEDFS